MHGRVVRDTTHGADEEHRQHLFHLPLLTLCRRRTFGLLTVGGAHVLAVLMNEPFRRA